jgi:hypothetical protein
MKKLWLVFTLVLAACTQREGTPESALKDFVQGSLGQVITREFVLKRVTGKLEQSVTHMSDEDFNSFSNMTALQQDGFKVLSKSCQETRCFLTYTVAYGTNRDKQRAFKTEAKKIAEMTMVDGKWLISDVSNVKTFHEALEPINPID